MRLRCAATFAVAAMSLAGCASSDFTKAGMNFGLPEALLEGPAYSDAKVAVDNLTIRNRQYLVAANGAANGTQKFDLAAILAGTLGVASVAFQGVTEDMRPTAGTLGAGALGLRSYYNTGSRYGAYVGGARGTSCLLQLAEKLNAEQLTAEEIEKWRTERAAAQASGTPEGDAIVATANAVISAPSKLASAAVRVDTEVMRKLKSPDAPDLSTYMQSFEAASQKTESEKKAMQIAKAAFVGRAAAREVALRAAKADQAAGLSPRAVPAAPGVQPSQALIDALTGFDAKIEQCVAYAV